MDRIRHPLSYAEVKNKTKSLIFNIRVDLSVLLAYGDCNLSPNVLPDNYMYHCCIRVKR